MGFNSQNFGFTADDVDGGALRTVRGVGPGFLHGDVDRGVNDARLLDLRAGQKHELGFVKNTVGRRRSLDGNAKIGSIRSENSSRPF